MTLYASCSRSKALSSCVFASAPVSPSRLAACAEPSRKYNLPVALRLALGSLLRTGPTNAVAAATQGPCSARVWAPVALLHAKLGIMLMARMGIIASPVAAPATLLWTCGCCWLQTHCAACFQPPNMYSMHASGDSGSDLLHFGGCDMATCACFEQIEQHLSHLPEVPEHMQPGYKLPVASRATHSCPFQIH